MFSALYLSLDILLTVLNLWLISKMKPHDQCFPIIFNACFASLYLFLFDLQIYFDWFHLTFEGFGGCDSFACGTFTARIFWYKVMIVLGLVGSVIRERRTDWEEWEKAEKRIAEKLDKEDQEDGTT